MRNINIVYPLPSGTLTTSQTDRDIFDADSYLKRMLQSVPTGVVWLLKDLAISCTARGVQWVLYSGPLELGRGDCIFVSNRSQLDLNFVPDLNLELWGGMKLAMLCTSDATLANSTLHVAIHEYGFAEYNALKAGGAQVADL